MTATPDVYDTHEAPAAPRAIELLSRADAELLAAQFSPEAWERFSHAHLAGLRAAAAVVAARGSGARRRGQRTVWELLAAAAPELADWSHYFAAGASLRSAVDAGRFDAVSSARAEQTLCAAEDFVDAARAAVTAAAVGTVPVPTGEAGVGEVPRRQRMLAVQAS